MANENAVAKILCQIEGKFKEFAEDRNNYEPLRDILGVNQGNEIMKEDSLIWQGLGLTAAGSVQEKRLFELQVSAIEQFPFATTQKCELLAGIRETRASRSGKPSSRFSEMAGGNRHVPG